LAGLALLFTDHSTPTNAGAYGPARGEFDEVMEPVTNVLSAPVRWIGAAGDWAGGYFFAVTENRELKRQVADLKRWRDAAVALKNENLRYEALLKLRTEPPIPMVAARAVSDSRGPFSDARLLDVGSDAGVKLGNPAMSEDGVLGRIVGVTKNVSRLLLLTDVESRTPVLIDRTNARAILTGDGGPNPKLEFVRGLNSVQDGDTVLTSGDGGLYPRGLPVGVAAKDFRGVWRVRLYADRTAIDYVRILLFDDFASKVNQADLADNALPPLPPSESAELAAAKAAAARPPSPPAAPAPPSGQAPPAAMSPAPAPQVSAAAAAPDAGAPAKGPSPALSPNPKARGPSLTKGSRPRPNDAAGPAASLAPASFPKTRAGASPEADALVLGRNSGPRPAGLLGRLG
jgi:rod shape-determining protein MreC